MATTEIEIAHASEQHIDRIPDLVHATGPVSYDYIFGPDRVLFDQYIRRSFPHPDSLYSMNDTTVALQGDTLLGIEIGYSGLRYYALEEKSQAVALEMVQAGEVTVDELRAFGRRAYLNDFQLPKVPDDAYYIMALSVTEASRGKGVGAKLLTNAIDRARDNGFRTLHLDVLSDNPAVDFYRRMGLTCMAETSSPELRENHGIPVEYRMVIDLAA